MVIQLDRLGQGKRKSAGLVERDSHRARVSGLTPMKIVATRRYPGPAFDELDDVEVATLDALQAPREDVEGLILANEPVPLDLLPHLRIVANFGVGYDRIDVVACATRGVVVTNTPGVLDDATADLAFALILAARRRVVEGDRLVRSGGWAGSWSEGGIAQELTGSTLGILGLGRIGSAVARRARGFELRVLYTQRSRVETELGEYRELDELFEQCDIVTIHAPLTAETDRLVDARRLALLRDGGCLVNTARGEIVDEEALVRELVSGRIRAGLDVFAHEPDVPRELLDLPNVVLTPHIGSATQQTREAMTRLVVDNLLAVERGDPPLTSVGGTLAS
jgi:glyoxylate reductase